VQMKNLFLIIIIVFGLQLTAYAQTGSKMYKRFLKGIYHKKTPTISCDSLNIAHDKYVLIDTRSEEEYEVSHLEGAEFLNYDTYQDVDITQYDKETPIIFYCSVGWRSQEVTEYFMKQDFNNVYNLYGGIFEWSNNDLPLYNIKGEDTDSVHVFSKKWGFWLKSGVKVY